MSALDKLLGRGDLVKSKWEHWDGFVATGVILGWETASGLPAARVLWTDKRGTRETTVLRHHLEPA